MKIKFTKEINDSLNEFFENSFEAACKTKEQAREEFKNIFSGTRRNRMEDGIVFIVSTELQKQANELVGAFCKQLGPIVSERGSIAQALWAEASKIAHKTYDIEEAKHQLKDKIECIIEKSKRYVHGNRLIFLDDGVEDFKIGPVAIIRGSDFVSSIDAEALKLEIEVGQSFDHDFVTKSDRSILKVENFLWDIDLYAAESVISAEAEWLAGIAVSLLYMTCANLLGPYVYRSNKPEPKPFFPDSGKHTGIILGRDRLSVGGMWVPARYIISADTVRYCDQVQFTTIVDHIFEASKKKIGERVRQALGWLARGRQSSDRADRFLHFFTAIEALLSSDDRNTPIIQNIARNAASILDDTPVGRENIAKTLKDLYSTRSKLVHTGSRNIGDDQVSELENIAHILCWHIIDRTDLSITVQEFQESLQKSSYGLPWKEEEKGRIPV